MLNRLGHTAVFASDGQMAIDMATATDAGTLTCMHTYTAYTLLHCYVECTSVTHTLYI
jgi:hypothetical protein